MTLLQECIAALRARGVIVLAPSDDVPTYSVLGRAKKLSPLVFQLSIAKAHMDTPHRCEVTG